MSDFDRNAALKDGSAGIREQAEIAVYIGGHGDVAIVQKGQYGPDEDSYVTVVPENALALAEAVIKAAGLIARPGIDWAAAHADFSAFEARSKSQTSGAARSKRYRDRKKERGAQQSVTRDSVTQNVTPPVTKRDDQDQQRFKLVG